MEVKLLDKSWITNVEVRFAALFRFGLVCSVDPCLTPRVRVGLSHAERPDLLLGASRAALLHREGLRQLPVPSARGPPMLQRSGQLLRHHQTQHSQMCKCVLAACCPSRVCMSVTEPAITTLCLCPVQNCSCSEGTQTIVDTLRTEYNKVGAVL